MTPDQYRIAAGLSHKAMYERLEISPNTWRRYRNDSKAPRWLILASAAIRHHLLE